MEERWPVSRDDPGWNVAEVGLIPLWKNAGLSVEMTRAGM